MPRSPISLWVFKICSTAASSFWAKRLHFDCVTGYICEPFTSRWPLLCLQHRWLQVPGRHDPAHSFEPALSLRLLYSTHQQETAFRLHILPEGTNEEWHFHDIDLCSNVFVCFVWSACLIIHQWGLLLSQQPFLWGLVYSIFQEGPVKLLYIKVEHAVRIP